MGVLLGGETVSLGAGDAVGVRVMVEVGEPSAAATSSVLEGVWVAVRRVALGTAVVGLGVLPGALVRVGRVSRVGGEVGGGPTVGTVWKTGAPQLWL